MRLAAPTGLCLLAFVSLVGCQGTTRSLKEIFIGRCHEFYRVKFPDLPLKNCSMLWDKFHKAFSNRSACDVKPEDYKDYLEYADDGRLLSKVNSLLFSWTCKTFLYDTRFRNPPAVNCEVSFCKTDADPRTKIQCNDIKFHVNSRR